MNAKQVESTVPSAPADELLAKLDQPNPEAWIPKAPGDTIVGVFLSVGSGIKPFGPAKFAVLATDEGERTVWFFSEAIRSGFLRAKPAPGERVAVRYLGKEQAKNPTPGRAKEYNNFKVVVDRPLSSSAEVDWEKELGVVAAMPEPVVSDTEFDEIPF